MVTTKSLGEVNGWWLLLIKLMLATHPILFTGMIAWGSWATMQTIENQFGVTVLHQRMDDHNARASHPGAVTASEMEFVISRLDRIEAKLDKLGDNK